MSCRDQWEQLGNNYYTCSNFYEVNKSFFPTELLLCRLNWNKHEVNDR